jgi:hypothetical protein
MRLFVASNVVVVLLFVFFIQSKNIWNGSNKPRLGGIRHLSGRVLLVAFV